MNGMTGWLRYSGHFGLIIGGRDAEMRFVQKYFLKRRISGKQWIQVEKSLDYREKRGTV